MFCCVLVVLLLLIAVIVVVDEEEEEGEGPFLFCDDDGGCYVRFSLCFCVRCTDVHLTFLIIIYQLQQQQI